MLGWRRGAAAARARDLPEARLALGFYVVGLRTLLLFGSLSLSSPVQTALPGHAPSMGHLAPRECFERHSPRSDWCLIP